MTRSARFWFLIAVFSSTLYGPSIQAKEPPKLEALVKALAEENDKIKKSDVQLELGDYYFFNHGSADSALLYYHEAYEVYKSEKKELKTAVAQLAIAEVMIKLNKLEQFIDELKEAEQTFIKYNKNEYYVKALNFKTFFQTPSEDIETYQKMLEISENKFPTYYAKALNNIGSTYKDLGQLDSANYYFRECIQYSTTNEQTSMIAFSSYNLGSVQKERQEYQSAFTNIQKALRIFEESKQAPSAAWVRPKLVELDLIWKRSSLYYPSPLSKKVLIELLEKSRMTSLNSKNFKLIESLHEAYISFYSYHTNKDSIIHHQKKLMALRDKNATQEQAQAIAKFQQELNIAENEKKIVQLNAQNKISTARAQRNTILFIIALLGTILGLGYSNFRNKIFLEKKKEQDDKSFRTKLSSNLHDDVGTLLTSLSMQSELLKLKANKDIQDRASKIASLSRDASRRMRDTVWAIDSRKDNIMDLAYRMIDFAEDILEANNVEFQLEHNIDGKDDKISAELRQNIFLIFKEAITNAAKYGSGNLVSASLQKKNELLELIITNQFDKKINLDKVSGLGLSNIKKRAQDLGGNADINILEESFIVNLEFPL